MQDASITYDVVFRCKTEREAERRLKQCLNRKDRHRYAYAFGFGNGVWEVRRKT